MAQIRQASPKASWNREYTEEHEDIYQSITNKIKAVSKGEPEDPMAVVGPYGSGKTQLLFEAFNHAWSNGVPALYTDARTIFNEFERSSESSIQKWLESRVDEQLDTLKDVNDADWLPSYQSTSERREEIESYASDVDFTSIDTCVLLIDEIEQSYTKLEKQIGTDDDNAFRVILDEVEEIYQIWSFGLVSAYEILGEADVRRFEEVRIPILDVTDIKDVLKTSDMPDNLSNGIWWLSRGRVGWARKLIDEGPKEMDEVPVWIRDIVTNYEFDGIRVLDENSYTSRISNSADFDESRKSIMFLDGGYTEWQVDSNRAISAKNASEIILDIIRDEDTDAGAIRILERNLERLTRSFSPIGNWAGDSLHLPPTIFVQSESVSSFLELLEDFILSYEPRGDPRDDAVDLIQGVDSDRFQTQWMDESGKRAEDDREAWSINPVLVDAAYPPVAVNPDHLTEYSNQELRNEMKTPVAIKPGVSGLGMRLKVLLCPTETSFQNAVEIAEENQDITKTYVLIRPGREDAQWEIESWGSTLQNYCLLQTANEGGERLWNFILQLDRYIQENTEYEGPLSERKIENILKEETDRETKNTIDALYDQVHRISQNTTRNAQSVYKKRYSLTDSDKLIWEEKELEGETPFWGYSGSSTIPRIGLAFALALTETDETSRINRSKIVASLIEGHDERYIHQADFPYKEFLDKFFTKEGIRKKVREARDTFMEPGGTFDKNLRLLSNLLIQMSEHYDEDQSIPIKSLLNPDADIGEISVIASASTQKYQAPALMWGLLLYQIAERDEIEITERLESLKEEFDTLHTRVEQARSNIDQINDVLTPPEDLGEGVSVATDEVDNYLDNVASLSSGLEELIEDISSHRALNIVGLSYYIILDRYKSCIEDSIGTIEEGVTDPRVVYDIEDLETEYNNLREVLANEIIVSQIDMSRDEINEEIENLGDEIFNFYKWAGTDTVSPSSKETLQEISHHASSEMERIDELNEKVVEVEEKEREKEQRKRTVINNLDDLFETVHGGNGGILLESDST